MSVAPEEFKRQENKQAFWSQRAHSLSHPQAHSFFLSLLHPPPAPTYSLVVFARPFWWQSVLFLDPHHLSGLETSASERRRTTSRDLMSQGDTAGRTAKQCSAAQGLLYFTGTGIWHGKFPHHSTELDHGLQHKAPPHPPPTPVKIFCHAHASCLISNKRAFVRVFSYACECSWCEKAILSHCPSALTVCCSLGVAALPFAPSGLFSIFKTQQTSSLKNRHELSSIWDKQTAGMKNMTLSLHTWQ